MSTASVETLLTLRFSKQLYSVRCTVYSVHTALVYRPQSSHVRSNHFISPAFIEQQMSSDHQTVSSVRLMVSIKFPLFTFDCVFISTIFIQSNQRETPDSSRQLSHKHSTSERRKIKADDGIYNNINVGVLTQCFQ